MSKKATAKKYTTNGELLEKQNEILKNQALLAEKQEALAARFATDTTSLNSEMKKQAGEVLQALHNVKDSLDALAEKVDAIAHPEEEEKEVRVLPKKKGWRLW